MANALIEQIDSRSATKDVAGHPVGASRVFKGPNLSSEPAAQLAFRNEAGLKHPDYPELDLLTVTATPLPSGSGYKVEAQYGKRSSSQFKQPPRDDPAYAFFAPGPPVARKVELPVTFRRVFYADDGGNPYFAYDLAKESHTEYRPTEVFKARIYGANHRDFDVIGTQIGKVHRFSTSEWLFYDGTVSEGDGTYVDVRYCWERDNGTPYINRGSTSSIYTQLASTNPDLLRLPYTERSAIQSEDIRVTPWVFYDRYPYPRDPDGWRALPGMGRLNL